MSNVQILADCHIHTYHSHDSQSLFSDYCDTAIQNGVGIITVADHCDMPACRWECNCDNVRYSAEEAKKYDEMMGDRLTVISGVELGDVAWNPKLAEKVALYDCFDAILGSVHAVAYKQYGIAVSRIDFSYWSDDEIGEFMTAYFSEMTEMLSAVDINVLSHLTVPLRYINGRYGKGFSLEPFYETLEKILCEIIHRGIALEVNTSSFAAIGTSMPDETILRMYKNIGGNLITLGSDAHLPINLASSFKRTLKLLKAIGFEEYYYAKNKKFLPINII